MCKRIFSFLVLTSSAGMRSSPSLSARERLLRGGAGVRVQSVTRTRQSVFKSTSPQAPPAARVLPASSGL